MTSFLADMHTECLRESKAYSDKLQLTFDDAHVEQSVANQKSSTYKEQSTSGFTHWVMLIFTENNFTDRMLS